MRLVHWQHIAIYLGFVRGGWIGATAVGFTFIGPSFLMVVLLALSAFANAAIGFGMATPTGRIVDANPAYCAILGYRVEELRALDFSVLIHPEDRAANMQQIERMLAGALAGFTVENRYVRKGGEPVWVRKSVSLVRDAHGAPRWIVALIEDITARKQVEDANRRHSTVLAAINRVLEMGLGQQTEEEMCEACLDVVEKVTASRISFIGEIGPDGLLHALAISNPDWEACKIHDQTGHRRRPGNFLIHGIYGRVLMDGKGLIVNDPASHPDRIGFPEGHPLLTAFLGEPLLREGKPVGMVAVGNREGGYRREDQQALEAMAVAIIEALDRKRAQIALRASEERFRALVTASSDVVYRMSPDWSEMRYLHGRELIADTLEPSRTWLQKYIHPDDQAHVMAVIQEAIRTRSIFELEHRVLRVDGSLGWTFSRAIPLLDAKGEIVEWFGAASDVTQRKRAEEALRTSEERFRVAQELSPDGFSILRPVRDVQGRVIDFTWVSLNATTARITGSDLQALLGRNLLESFPGHRGSPLFETYQQVAETGGTQVCEALYEGDGILSGRWFRVAVVSMGNDIAVLSQDITERKRAEQQLAANLDSMSRLQKLGTLFVRERNMEPILGEIVEAAMAIAGADFGNIQLLDTKTAALRIAAQRGFPQWWVDFWNEGPSGHGTCGTALEQGERVIVEDLEQHPIFAGTPALEIQRKAGVRAVQSTPLVSRSGKLIGMFSTHYKRPCRPSEDALRLLDLLARQAADMIESARAEEALRDSQRRFMIAKEAAELGIHDYDVASGAIQWDARVRRLWGVGKDEPITYDTFISGVHPEDRAAVQAAVERALNPSGNGKYSSEYRVRSRVDGVERWVFATGEVLFEQGRAVRLVGTVQDITNRKQALELLIRSEKVAALGRMAAGLAHDINNPLSAVMNTLFLARGNPECAECAHSVRPYLEVADEELRRISHITQQALGFYREGSTPTKVAIRTVLDETVDIFRSKIKSKNARVEKQYEGEVIEVVGISGELRQMLSNLLANSLDAISQNGIIKLRVRTSPDGRVRITIADDGKGIEPAAMPRIFEPLYTTKGSLGTGLGLWVTKQLIDKHGGSIRVRSSVNARHRGTTFLVVLTGATAARGQAAATA